MQIDFTESELQILAGFLDHGVKTLGLRAVKDAAIILPKLETAAEVIKSEVSTDV